MEKQRPQFYYSKVKIFFPDIHITLTRNFGKALEEIGYELVIPSKDYKVTQYPPQKWVWNESHDEESLIKHDFGDNTILVNNDQLMEIKPDVIFVSAFENQFEVINVIWQQAKNWGAKLAFYSGNDYWESAYPWDIIKNYLPADNLAASICKEKGVHHHHYRPWVDYEMFSYEGPSQSNKVGTYICDYKNNFSEDFEIYNTIKNNTSNFIDYILCEHATKKETADIMNESAFTLHVKRLEGYGFAIIESMARGRPVFFLDQLTANKSFLQWSELGTTAFSFHNGLSYDDQAKKILEDEEYRAEVQQSCAKRIRELVNNEEQNEKLKNFLNNLR